MTKAELEKQLEDAKLIIDLQFQLLKDQADLLKSFSPQPGQTLIIENKLEAS